MTATFPQYLTLDARASHGTCALVQLNRFILDGHSNVPGDYFQNFRAYEAGKHGKCGRAGLWGYCSLSVQYGSPIAPRDFPQAGDKIDWKGIVDNAVERAMAVSEDKPFIDGNHRTALMTMFEAISYNGLHITNDVDVFRLYVLLKSLTDNIGNFPKKNHIQVKKEMIKLLKDVVRIRPSPRIRSSAVTYEARLSLAYATKVDLPHQIAEMETSRKHLELELALAGDADAKRKIVRGWNQRLKKENSKALARFKYVYPQYVLV